MTNEIRECANCEAVMTEGYLAEWSGDCFCSKSCAVRYLGEEDVQEGLEDETFFYTVWFMFDSVDSTTGKPEVIQVYRMHDNIYFTEAHARVFDDGKDRISIEWAVITPDDTWYEGGQAENYHLQSSYRLAKELAEELTEDY